MSNLLASDYVWGIRNENAFKRIEHFEADVPKTLPIRKALSIFLTSQIRRWQPHDGHPELRADQSRSRGASASSRSLAGRRDASASPSRHLNRVDRGSVVRYFLLDSAAGNC